MAFFLSCEGREFLLSEGRFVIGRNEDCDLCVEDPLASRQHAAISSQGGELVLEDLGSRNGVFLNRTRLKKPEVLREGDVIRIGELKMSVVKKKAPRAETLAQLDAVSAGEAFLLLGGLAEKALALGRGDEAERILGRQLEQILERAAVEELDGDTIARSGQYALSIAALTKKPKWIDYLFALYSRSGALMDAQLVNELYALCPKVPGASRLIFRDYLESLAARQAAFGPSERFLFSRLGSLEKQL